MLRQFQNGDLINEEYQILGYLGKGGMGVTYSAQSLKTQSPVAVKAISLHEFQGKVKQWDGLNREVETLKTLNHRGIPAYLDYFELDYQDDYIYCLVQELAEGENLEKWIEKGWRVTEGEVKDIAAQILNILDYLHNLSPAIIHRDIKPHNIIRSQTGKLYLVDFGAVQHAYNQTVMGGHSTVGTFGYFPMEQARGKAVPASDLYALGMTLLYLLTHRSPEKFSYDGLRLDFRSHVSVSPEFADWLEKMLEPEVEERFQSAKEALEGLKKPKLVREGKLSARRGLVGLGLGIVAGGVLCYQYKWGIYNSLGYPPPDTVCENKVTAIDYLSHRRKLPEDYAFECFARAIQKGDKNVVEMLIAKGADINAKDGGGYVPLHIAAVWGQKDIVEMLIAKGADVNAKDNGGQTPLHETSRNGKKEMVEMLIAKGADVNAKDNGGQTPLHYALERVEIDIAEVLIAKGADFNAKNRDGDTPLHEASLLGLKQMVEMLIAKGADVNARNNGGNTPLYEASLLGRKQMVEMLIAKGADVNAKDNGGNTPLHIALERGNIDIVELLKKHGAKY